MHDDDDLDDLPAMRRHVIALSGGKDSTAMALRLRELHPDREFTLLTTMTGNELTDVRRHAERIAAMIGGEWLNLNPFDGDGLLAVARQENCIPNFRRRFCTRILKIQPAIKWLADNAPCIQYVGLRSDEEEREGIYGTIAGVTQAYPMREWGWGLPQVVGYLQERGIEVPTRTDCALCYHQRIGEWYRLWKEHPEEFAAGIEIEKELGYTFRSPGRDTWPSGLKELGEAFASGREPLVRKRNNCDMDATCRVCTM